MRNNQKLLFIVPLLIFLSGCLTFKDQKYRFDYETGVLEVNYHDFRSLKEEKDKDDYMGKDWASLNENLNKKDDYIPDVVHVTSKKIFQDGNVLSGKAIYQVQCVKCFPSKLDLLKFLYSDGHWDVVNDEIFLILPSSMALTSTNGKLIKTERNNICVWPLNEKVFEYTISTNRVEGESLLGKYLSENKKK